MSPRSDLGVVVWDHRHPVPRREVWADALSALSAHYVRLIQTTITGKDPAK